MTAQPVADFWYEQALSDTAANSPLIDPLALATTAASDLSLFRQQFGLLGAGQTVAVIDSGIAYDHVALGGGLGSGYKVVGGWDFAENDNNPYDDAPAGFHGTHVAGIIGAEDARYAGVASGVDLVSLRVFNDQGGGYFSWVEQALSWVHDHRNSFASPITTVNLSLGTEWNSTSLPKWATLEDELKRLADDGLFVTVAAGNSFLTYGAAGLSYPAASPHVVPVASVDASGNLSRFSQRASGVLAAPGERVTSTVPDAFYGGDGNKNDWGAASGTSMAAPQIAGAGVLVREAMQKLGQQNVTGASIRQLLQQTADAGIDPLTGATFYRVNTNRAIETLVGADDFANSFSEAKQLGTLSSTLTVSGTIGSLTDRDFFQFTAARSGAARITLTDPQQAASWITPPGARLSGQELTFSITAGQSYAIGLAATGASIGKFTVDLQIAAAPGGVAPTDWGAVTQRTIDDVSLAAPETWFEVLATRTGTLTVEALTGAANSSVQLELHGAPGAPLASRTTSSGPRLDAEVVAGQRYLIRATGTSASVDFRLTNLLTKSGTSVTVAGTAAADDVRFTAATQQLLVNGVEYALSGVTQITVHAGQASDRLLIEGSAAAETITLAAGLTQLTSTTTRLTAHDFETVEFRGSAGDRATFTDTAASDLFEARPAWARMSASGYSHLVTGVSHITAQSQNGGLDTARLMDSAGNDQLRSAAGVVVLEGSGLRTEARGFSQVLVLATAGGFDTATLQDSAAADQLDASSRYVWLRNTASSVRLEGFDSVVVNATRNSGDVARFWGSAGSDVFSIWSYQRHFASAGVNIQVTNFAYASFDGGGGFDTVEYYSSSRDARLYGRTQYGRLVDQAFETDFVAAEAIVARVRSSHRLKAELAAIEFYYQRLGWN